MHSMQIRDGVEVRRTRTDMHESHGESTEVCAIQQRNGLSKLSARVLPAQRRMPRSDFVQEETRFDEVKSSDFEFTFEFRIKSIANSI